MLDGCYGIHNGWIKTAINNATIRVKEETEYKQLTPRNAPHMNYLTLVGLLIKSAYKFMFSTIDKADQCSGRVVRSR